MRLETTMRKARSVRRRSLSPFRIGQHLHFLSLAILLLLTEMPAQAQQGAVERANLIIRNARVFDGVEWRSGLTIVISGDRILEVTDKATRFEAHTELDASEWTIIPGLIDTHVHILDNRSKLAVTPWVLEQLEHLLQAGVTTIQSTGDITADIVVLRSQVAAGSVLGPRLFVTGGILTAPGGHPASTNCMGAVRCMAIEVDNEAAVRRVVAELASARVNGVKLVVDHDLGERTLPLSLVSTAIETAHTYGLRTIGHITEVTDVRAAMNLGLDAFAHPVPWRSGAASEVSELLARQAVPVSTTLSLRAPYIAPDGSMTNWVGAAYPDNRFQLFQHAIEVVRTLHRAGVPLAVGTDNSLSFKYLSAEERYMRELQLLVKAGLSTTDVLRAATRNAARHLGAADLGTIAPDNVADLVILIGDPEKTVLELESVLMVLKAGQIVVDNRMP